MKKLTSTLLLITALFGTITLKAQMDTVKTKNWFMHAHDFSGAAQIQLTYRKGNISQLNHILNNNGIPSINQYDFWINASMSHIHHNWLMEDGVGFTPRRQNTGEEATTQIAKYIENDKWVPGQGLVIGDKSTAK
jgi:hypothetical protein